MSDDDTAMVRDNRDAPPSGYGARRTVRASDTDRDLVVELLNVAYSQGRLTKDEYDGRLEIAFSARTYADLDQIVADLPAAPGAAAPATTAGPMAKTNGLAIASLACGLGHFMFGPLATIPAIVLGHMARNQIRRTGEQGAGLALAGLILGWAAVILAIVVIVVGLAVTAGMHAGAVPLPKKPELACGKLQECRAQPSRLPRMMTTGHGA